MRGIWHDLRYGLRMLVRSPGVTAAALASLSLGIGANTAIFSLVNGALLRPLPVEEPERLVRVLNNKDSGGLGRVSYQDYRDLRGFREAFSGVALHYDTPVSVKGGGRAQVVLGSLVSDNYFTVRGVKPGIGRDFLPEENRPQGGSSVAILSHGIWSREFTSDPNVAGKTVLVNSRPFVVVGVAPEGFTSTLTTFAPDVWVPMAAAPHVASFPISLTRRGHRVLRAVGRLREGVHLEQAQAQVDVLAANLRREHPDTDENMQLTLAKVDATRFSFIQGGEMVAVFGGILMGVVGLVLLIACMNVANLMLARASVRQREIAMRAALGAGRRRIVRQLLTEGVVLALLAGAAGTLFAVWLVAWIESVEAPTPVPVVVDYSVDLRVLGFTLLVSLLAGVLFSLAPAIRAGSLNLCTVLKDQRPGACQRKGQSRLQSSLVVAQVAISLTLLVGAGLCVRSLWQAQTIDLGFDRTNSLVVGLNLGYGQYDEKTGQAFYNRLVDRVERLPGVRSASLALFPPLGVSQTWTAVSIAGYEPPDGEEMRILHNIVSPRYFETLGIPLLGGRGIEDRDQKNTELAVVINETMARSYWSGTEPVGARIRVGGSDARVVGVVRDSKYVTLGEAPRPFFYLALSQAFTKWSSLHVKSEADPRAVIEPVLRELEAVDPNLPVAQIHTMEEHLRLAELPALGTGSLIGSFGLLALVLAMVGVYGVMSYSVRQRMQEFGIRTALGAGQGRILRQVMSRGLKITLIGVALGLAGAAAVTRVLSSFLYGVSTFDPTVFTGVSLLLIAIALVACYLPARWAARVDPMAALRYE
ncbi:MAG: ABC transporter permease [bacterium]|nr:ABC transporter permease [bacterium]